MALTAKQKIEEKKANRRPPLTIKDARLMFRNFSGRQTQYNPAGQRNFNIVINPEDVEQLKADGWNIRTKAPRPEYPDEETLYLLPVKVHYSEHTRPPRVVMISGGKQTELDEDSIEMLDRVQIEKVDLRINPSYYHIEATGLTGYKAYLQAIYVTVVLDELEEMYTNFGEDATDFDNDL